jgi:hypothetical protein
MDSIGCEVGFGRPSALPRTRRGLQQVMRGVMLADEAECDHGKSARNRYQPNRRGAALFGRVDAWNTTN